MGTIWVGGMLLIMLLLALQRFLPARALPKRLRKYVLPSVLAVDLRGVGVQASQNIVSDFLTSMQEGQFGLPSGFFAVDKKRSTAQRLVFRERVSWVPAMVTMAKRLKTYRQRYTGVRMYFVLGLAVVMIAETPFILASELFTKTVLRSQIDAAFEELPGGEFGSHIVFQLRGPSAMLLRRQITKSLDHPVLPAKVERTIAAA